MNPISILAGVAAGLATQAAAAMELKSGDLGEGAPIAIEQLYTRCGGKNVAPALSWSGAPSGTRSFVLTFVDTSVLPSGWSHWLVVNLPPSAGGLPKGGTLPSGATAIESNFGDLVYDGPCPPAGTGVHNYEFTLYALPRPAPAIVGNSNANELARALSALALAKATLKGTAMASPPPGGKGGR